MKRYRKLVAYAVGILALLLGPSFLGLSPGNELWNLGQDKVVEIIIALGTGFGIWKATNDTGDGS